MANPYAIFASRILKLEAMPVLGATIDASLRGSVIHEALGKFSAHYPGALPQDIPGALQEFARAALLDLVHEPRVAAFWLPRFARFAAWFAETEAQRRRGIGMVLAELPGSLVWMAPAGPFTLRARADRIDLADDGVVITDYKTGADLSSLASRAAKGEAPQLVLEALIAINGGFDKVPAGRVKSLRYISASGGEPPGRETDIKSDDIAALVAAARAGLEKLIASFDNPSTPYTAVRRPRFDYAYDDFAHLARVAEWSGGGDDAEDDEGGAA